MGGLIGFSLSNTVCLFCWRKPGQSDQRSFRAVQSLSISTIIAYFFFSMSFFAFLNSSRIERQCSRGLLLLI